MKKIIVITLALLSLQTHANKFHQFKKIVNCIGNMWNKKDVFKATNTQFFKKTSKTSEKLLNKGSKNNCTKKTLHIAQTSNHAIPLGFPFVPSPLSILKLQQKCMRKQYQQTKDWHYESPHARSWRKQQKRNRKIAAVGLIGAGGLCLYAQSQSHMKKDEEDTPNHEKCNVTFNGRILSNYKKLKATLDPIEPKHQQSAAMKLMEYLHSCIPSPWNSYFEKILQHRPKCAKLVCDFIEPHIIYLAQNCPQSVGVVNFIYKNNHKHKRLDGIIQAINQQRKAFAKTKHGPEILQIFEKSNAQTKPQKKTLKATNTHFDKLPQNSLLRKTLIKEQQAWCPRRIYTSPAENACNNINAIFYDVEKERKKDTRATWWLKICEFCSPSYLTQDRTDKIRDAIKRALPKASEEEQSKELDYCKNIIKNILKDIYL